MTGLPKSAADALRLATAWEAEMARTGTNRAAIARRERITRARVTQIMSLLDLPDHLKTMLLGDHKDVEGWSIRKALTEVGSRRVDRTGFVGGRRR